MTRLASTTGTRTTSATSPGEITEPTVSVPTTTPIPPTTKAIFPPPGAEIAFIGSDGLLWLLELDGNKRIQVTARGKVVSPAWSPDGSALAYGARETDDGSWLVILYKPESRSQELLAQFDGPIQSLVWSPNGRFLAIDRGTSMASQLLVVEVATGRIHHDLGIIGGCAWSPDGSCLVLGLRRPLDKPISVEAGDSVSLAVLELGQAEPRTVLEGTSQVLYLASAWLPDGRLLYKRLDWDEETQTGAWTTWTMNLSDPVGEPEPAQNLPLAYDLPTLLARLPGEFQDPVTTSHFSWSPEGRWVVFRAGRCPQCGIYLFDTLQGGSPRHLADGTSPAWRPRHGS